MGLNFKEAVEQALESNADDLAGAGSTEAVTQLASKIASDAQSKYDATKDPWAYRSVIVILGLVVVTVVITYAIYALLPWTSATPVRELPDALISLGSASVGALAGLLAPPPR